MHESDFDKAQSAIFRECPDLIAGFGEWETLKYCANCDGILNEEMPCMHSTAQGENEKVPSYQSPFAPSVIACPHCKKMPPLLKVYRDDDKVRQASTIHFKLIRRRKVFTFIPRGWKKFWGEQPKFFYEYSKAYSCGGFNEIDKEEKA